MTDGPQGSGGSNVWERLRRRKVVQWSLAYIAGGWGFLQGLEYASDVFDWPRPIQRVATITLLIGLPVAVALAWYHGDKGQQRVSRTELAVLTLLLLLGGGLFWYYQHSPYTGELSVGTPAAGPSEVASVPGDRSIAVLPFVNMSKDPEQEYFSDGISEELMSALARLGALKVAARTSAFSFKGKNVELREVGRTLNVGTVLEGSVRRSGQRVRITAQLSDVATGYQIWSEVYDRELTDIFAIQDDIASRIVEALQSRLDATRLRSSATRLDDPDVYDLVLRARFHWNQRSQDGFTKASELLQEATRRAPRYAPAYSALADVYLSQYDYGLMSWPESTALARAAVDKALELDSDSAAAHTSYAHILLHEWQWEAAEQEFRRAIEIDPSYTLALHWYALCLTALGRTDEAVEAMRRAQQLDPLSVRINADLGMALLAAGKYDDALAHVDRALELDPKAPGPRWIRGMALEQLGRFEEAEQDMKTALEAMSGYEAVKGSLGHLYAVSGRTKQARALLSELAMQAGKQDVAFFAALICAGLGDTDAALTWLEHAVDERSGSVRYLRIDPRLAGLRNEPRFQRLMQRVGLSR